MKIKKTRRILAALLCLCVLCLPGCQSTEENEPALPTAEPYEAKLPDAPVFTEDTTDYVAAVRAVFRDVAAKPEDFSFEVTENGTVCLTGYTGEGGAVVVPEKIDGLPVTTLSDGAFDGQTAITALYLPDSIREIGSGVLSGCRSLQVLRTPQMSQTRDDAGGSGYLCYLFGATAPKGNGFRVPSSLDTVILGGGCTSLDPYAFLECSRVKIVLLPDGMEKIGAFAFSGCSQLTFLRLPEALREVGDYAFESCSALTSLRLDETVERVGLGAFCGCVSLERLTLPFVGETRESENRHLGYVFGAEVASWNEGYVPKSLLRVEVLEGGIAEDAFYGCSSLKDILLPADCTRIGKRAFYGCASLREMCLPETVTAVDAEAFSGCSSLYRVTLPDGLKSLGLQAFFNCCNLYEFTVPESLSVIPASAFSGCRGLVRVDLGDGLSEIGKNAFYNCVALKTVEGRVPRVAEGNICLRIAADHPGGLQE